MEEIKGIGVIVILAAAAISDRRTYEIPDKIPIAGIVWWLLCLALEKKLWSALFWRGLLGGSCIAGGLLVLSLIMDSILKRESLGGGDIKLFFVTGLYLGTAGNLLNLMLSSIFGIAVCLVKRKNTPEMDGIPFAPMIALSTVICLIMGDALIEWYLSLFM